MDRATRAFRHMEDEMNRHALGINRFVVVKVGGVHSGVSLLIQFKPDRTTASVNKG